MTDRELTCRELVEFLLEYTSGELPPNERALFDAHLAECEDCRVYLDTYRETIRLAKGAFARPDDPVPASVPDDLVRSILAARQRR